MFSKITLYLIPILLFVTSCGTTDTTEQSPKETKEVLKTPLTESRVASKRLSAKDKQEKYYGTSGLALEFLNAHKIEKGAKAYSETNSIYKNEAVKFQIAVPPKWEISKNITESIPVAFYNPNFKPGSRFKDYIRVVVEPTEFKDSKDWYENNIHRYETKIKGFEFVKRGIFHSNGKKIYRAHYSYLKEDLPLEAICYFFVFDDQAVVISGHSHENNMENMLPFYIEYIGSTEIF